jgi:hypothetical protein
MKATEAPPEKRAAGAAQSREETMAADTGAQVAAKISNRPSIMHLPEWTDLRSQTRQSEVINRECRTLLQK